MRNRLGSVGFLAALLAAVVAVDMVWARGNSESPASDAPATTAEPAAGVETDTAPNPRAHVPFTNLQTAQAQATKAPVVLFFAADWCPTCQAALKDLNANGQKLGDITVYVVNYDKETSLKRQYGVTYQHTFVRIDRAGKALAVWSGGGVEEILRHVHASGDAM